MKWILSFVIYVCLTIPNLSAQKTSISLGGLKTTFSDLTIEIGSRTSIFKNTVFNARASSDFKNLIAFRSGLGYVLLNKWDLELEFGIDYSFEYFFITPNMEDKYHYLELPMTLRYGISNKLNMFAGVAYTRILGKNNLDIETSLISILRAGVSYKLK